MKVLILLLFPLFQSCSNVFYQPAKKHFLDPAQFKQKYEDIHFKSLDGTQLHGWFFPSKTEAKGTIVQFHGNAQNISTHFLSLLWLTYEGYNLFTFDYRGYGKSEGKPHQEGVYKDALAALEQGRMLKDSHGKGLFIIYGQSLGGIISLRALADYKYLEEVSLIVQDSTFSSYDEIAFEKISSHWFLLPFAPLAYLLISDKYASEDVFDSIRSPTLVIVGQKDRIIPQKFGKKIYKGIASKKKWLWKLPEGRHIEIFHNGQEKYREDFKDLLEELARE